MAVSCSSSTSCSAVGGAADQALTERWNGTTWSIQPTGTAPGATGAILLANSCPSRTVCVAVGYYTEQGGVYRPLVERWNGSQWSVQPLGTGVPDGELQGVSCPTDTRCTAVGAGAVHWNGTRWSIQSRRVSGQAVSCPSAPNCTAVGPSETGGLQAEHWNGKRWSPQPIFTRGYYSSYPQLTGVACLAHGHCVAVGRYAQSEDENAPLIAMWNGSKWSNHGGPLPSSAGEGQLSAVSCPTRNHCTAVGGVYTFNGDAAPLVSTWNGTTWSSTSP
jgi:hypothetical protein